jgi:DNA recombination protein Rad52
MKPLPGLNRSQIKKLVAKLDRRHVQQRMIEGKTIHYIEGWFAISQANAIFGFDGWDRKTLHLERLFEQTRFQETNCAYSARVRVRVKAGQSYIVREGSGFGEASAASRAAAHERALKAAETDATKRALATFGNRFGLALYDRDQAGVTPAPTETAPPPTQRFSLYGPAGEVVSDNLSAEAFCGGLRQMIEKTQIVSALEDLSEANRVPLGQLRDTRKDLVSAKGVPFVQILQGLLARRRQELGLRRWPVASGQASSSQDIPAALPDASPVGEQEDRRQTAALEHGPAGEEISEYRPSSPGDSPVPSHTVPNPIQQEVGIPQGPLVQQQPAPLSDPASGAGGDNQDANSLADATVEEGLRPSSSPSPLLSEPISHDFVLSAVTAGRMTMTANHQLPGRALADGLSQFQNPRVDKSQLLIGAERRVRSKSHLLFVSAKPCAICGDLPRHAHHVTFAQLRGLSVKVSDEFTVPLCPMHHNLLHQNRNERAFWRQHGIDALSLAAQLWTRTVQGTE